jgi:hypothetical protein
MNATSTASRRSPAGASAVTEFIFEHKVFQVPGCYFARSAIEDAAFHLKLGDLPVALSLRSLTREFSIAPGSSDGELLQIVAAGLRYVREIRPNDSIPRELLDGSASWSVEDSHLTIARNRLVMLVAGAELPEGGFSDAVAPDDQDPGFETGVSKLAKRLELDGATIHERIDQLSRELAYIEALRERFQLIRQLPQRLAQAGSLYRRDQTVFQSVLRAVTLLQTPVREFTEQFEQVDVQIGDIANALKLHHAQVSLIREVRDELHQRMLRWERLPDQWAELEILRGEKVENAIKELYRFVASNFPQMVDWRQR